MFAAWGGMTPPRPNVGRNPERDAAERAANLEQWTKALDKVNARPLPSPAETAAKPRPKSKRT